MVLKPFRQSDAIKPLAVSRSFVMFSEYEQATISDGSQTRDIASVYGDPTCGVIDNNEKWCAVAGSGLYVSRLTDLSRTLLDASSCDDCSLPGPTLWIEAMFQLDASSVGLVVGPSMAQEHRTLVAVDIMTMTAKLLGTFIPSQ